MTEIPSESESVPFIYKIVEFNVKDGNNFTCLLRGNISNKESFQRWLKQFSSDSKTKWILRSSKSSEKSKYTFFRKYVCHHSSYGKTSKRENAAEKNKECKASLKIAIKHNTRHTRYRDPHVKEGLCAVLNINFQHSHHVNAGETWGWLQRADKMREAFIQYFENGMSPENAWHCYEDHLLADEDEILDDAFVIPSKYWVYYLYNLWRQNEFGGASRCEAFFKQKALMEVQEVLHKILQNVEQNLDPVQQTSNVLDDPVCGGYTTASNIISKVSLNIISNRTSNVSQVIKIPFVAPTYVVKYINTLPVADNAVQNSCTMQTLSYNQPSTLSLVDSNGTSTLPVVVRPIQGSSGMRIFSNYDTSTLPLVPTAGQRTKRQRVSKSFAEQKISSLTKEEVLPLDSTAVQPKQKISKFIAEQKISGLAKKVMLKRSPNNPKQVTIRGRRIINFEYFFNSLKYVNNHSNYGCNLNDMVVTGEVKKGIYTTFKLKCTVCGFRKAIYSENTSKKINADFIAGMMSIKRGFEAMNKLLRKLHLPSLAYDFFTKECEKILLGKRNYSDIGTIRMLKEVSQKAADEDCNFPIIHKTSKELKNLDGPQTTPHQASNLLKETYQKTNNKISEKESLFRNVDLSDLVVEEQIEIKEERNDNVYENDSEAIIPPETVMKTCEDNVKEQESIDMTIIKQEINSDVDNEDLISSKTCEMETLDKESSIEFDDRSKQMLLQQKKIRTCEDKMTVNQEQVELHKFPVIQNNQDASNLIEPEFNGMDVKKTLSFISKLNQTCFEFVNQPETELPLKKCRTVTHENKVVVNQEDIKLDDKEAKQKLHSLKDSERLAKPKKTTTYKRGVTSCHIFKSGMKTADQQIRSETNELGTATSSTLNEKNVPFIPLQYMPKEKNDVISPQMPCNVTNRTYNGVNQAAFIPVTSAVIQEQTDESNSAQLPLVTQHSPSVSTSNQNPITILPVGQKFALPLNIAMMPGFNELTTKEREVCANLRIRPISFLKYKNILIKAYQRNGSLSLASARNAMKIDVNKTRKIYDLLLEERFINK